MHCRKKMPTKTSRKKSEPIVNTDPTRELPSVLEPEVAFTDREYRECFGLYCMEWTAAEIEERCGVRADKIRQWVHRDDWKILRDNVQKAQSDKHPPMSSPILKAVASARRDELKKKFVENMGEVAAENSDFIRQMAPEERLVVADKISSLNNVDRKSLELDKEEENNEKGHISLSFLTHSTEKVTVLDVQAETIREVKPEPVQKLTMDDF